MSNAVFGYHAVESLIRREPGRIAALHVQTGRQGKRMQALLTLARNQGVSICQEEKPDLDTRVSGRHQGVVAMLHAGASADAIGMMAEGELIECVTQSAEALLLILDGVTDPHNLGACLRSADAALYGGEYSLLRPGRCHCLRSAGASYCTELAFLSGHGREYCSLFCHHAHG